MSYDSEQRAQAEFLTASLEAQRLTEYARGRRDGLFAATKAIRDVMAGLDPLANVSFLLAALGAIEESLEPGAAARAAANSPR